MKLKKWIDHLIVAVALVALLLFMTNPSAPEKYDRVFRQEAPASVWEKMTFSTPEKVVENNLFWTVAYVITSDGQKHIIALGILNQVLPKP